MNTYVRFEVFQNHAMRNQNGMNSIKYVFLIVEIIISTSLELFLVNLYFIIAKRPIFSPIPGAST